MYCRSESHRGPVPKRRKKEEETETEMHQGIKVIPLVVTDTRRTRLLKEIGERYDLPSRALEMDSTELNDAWSALRTAPFSINNPEEGYTNSEKVMVSRVLLYLQENIDDTVVIHASSDLKSVLRRMQTTLERRGIQEKQVVLTNSMAALIKAVIRFRIMRVYVLGIPTPMSPSPALRALQKLTWGIDWRVLIYVIIPADTLEVYMWNQLMIKYRHQDYPFHKKRFGKMIWDRVANRQQLRRDMLFELMR